MKIPLTEPTAPRYIYVNPKTNTMHLLLPVVSGTGIGLDNTCKSVYAVQEFFGKSADVHQRAILDELMAYKSALEFDISLLGIAPELKQQKLERLQQIQEYIEATQEILRSEVLNDLDKALPNYPKPLQTLMTADDANIHSMHLRPKIVDASIRFMNSVFSVNRTKESVLYNALTDAFKNIKNIPGVKARIVSAVLASDAGKTMNFQGIQQQLQTEFKKQLNADIDFTRASNGRVLTIEFIDNEMIYGAGNPASSEGYIEALLYHCAQAYFAGVVEPPFYSAKHVDELSNITQFFLAQVNIYCRANKISEANFGTILDASKELSKSIADIVQASIQSGANIEDALLDFVNKNSDAFGLSSLLLPVEQALIKRQFTRHFAQIKETKEFDEFIILDVTKKRPFFPYQNAISVHFADFVRVGFPALKQEFFKKVKTDFETLNEDIPPNNPWTHQTVEVDLDELLTHIDTEEQLNNLLKKLPEDKKQEVRKSPIVQKLQTQMFLSFVAKGYQKEAEDLLNIMNPLQLLLHTDRFTDYSGRTFNCTAYEYAYWAKDKHMLRMLESYIVKDEHIKEELLKRCVTIENSGLNYTQGGQNKNSKHFDLTTLTKVLKTYIDGWDDWYNPTGESNMQAVNAAWMQVGVAQCDVPAHVADEYCRKDRSFDPLPAFNEADLPRHTPYNSWETGREEPWFPLQVSESKGLGISFALYRGKNEETESRDRHIGGVKRLYAARIDLTALARLDEVRTEDLKQSLESLKSSEPRVQLGGYS